MKNTQHGFAPVALIIIALIIAGGGGFYVAKKQAQKKAARQQEAMNNGSDGEKDRGPMVAETVVKLLTQNDSGVWGSAVLTEVELKTKVALELGRTPKGVVHPAHIHRGTCAELGEIKYVLTDTASDRSQTMLEISFDELLTELPLAVNIHKSGTEANVYVACGDITKDVVLKPLTEAMKKANEEQLKIDASTEVKAGATAEAGGVQADAAANLGAGAGTDADDVQDAETEKMLKEIEGITNSDMDAMMQ